MDHWRDVVKSYSMKCEFTFKSGDNLEQIEGCGWRNAERPRDGRTNGEQTTCVSDAGRGNRKLTASNAMRKKHYCQIRS